MGDKRDNIRIELLISEILRWGVRVSLALIVVGTLISFLCSGEYGNSALDLKKLLAMNSAGEYSLAIVWSGLLHFQGAAVIVAGLALLIATPILRVVASIVAFAIERDWVYVCVSAAVLALVAASSVFGSAG